MDGGRAHRNKHSEDGSFRRSVEHAPLAFAITRGAEHALTFANPFFVASTSAGSGGAIGRPIAEVMTGQAGAAIIVVLDEVFLSGVPAEQVRVGAIGEKIVGWTCTVWPLRIVGEATSSLVIELRPDGEAERSQEIQRDVTERMLLSALREGDAAASAEQSHRRTTVLADAGRKLATSLDRSATLDVVARLALPHFGSWCIVDALEADGGVTRLPIIHADPAKQVLARSLQGRWSSEPGDTFGAAAMHGSPAAIVINENVDAAINAAAHSVENLRVLRELGTGPLLTVPLIAKGRTFGTITFVGAQRDKPYTIDDVGLAQELASRSAMALDSAELYENARVLAPEAEGQSNAISTLLGNMSHELRTPLNAIGGYVDLIDMGIRGPVSEEQHLDLGRIRNCQRHLVTVVTDILDFVRVGRGDFEYHITDFNVPEAMASALVLIEPLIGKQGLTYEGMKCDGTPMVRADAEKVRQILVNLLGNAIKFTPAGGRIGLGCSATSETVIMSVIDTGIGIPPDKLGAVFEPFVQVRDGMAGSEGGVGLGLAISRTFARAMGGDLTVKSTLGAGSTFALALPRAKV